MKTYKTLLSIVMAIMMLLTMIVPTLATMEGELTGGSITIDNAVVGQTYNAYQLLYLESYNPTSGAYAYKANSAWETWLKTQTTYVSIDAQGYVTWVEGADAAAFAKLAQAYATELVEVEGKEDEEARISPDKTETATSTTVNFTGLNLGYYLIDTTLGTLCSLDTTNPSVTIKEKNGVPTNEKEVKEDSTNTFGKTNDADIGDTVYFQSTITAQAGAENYVLHDTMSAGLTYGSVTGITLNGNTVATTNYTVKTTDLTDGCTFEVIFTQDFCDTLKANDKIVVSYTATVNSNAVVGLDGNKNGIVLKYGDTTNPSSTPKSETITYTWDMDVLKYANGDESTVLADAQFVLLNKDKTKVAKFDEVYKKDKEGKDTKEIDYYRFNSWVDIPTGDAEWDNASILTTDANGNIHAKGLDADTYYLREVKAPAGYNKLAEDVKVEITGATKGDTQTYTTVVAKVNNQSGTELPSTGGIGTTIFYCAGAILTLGAFVLLVTKKRMGKE